MYIGETIMGRWDDKEKASDLSSDGSDFYDQGKLEESVACYNESLRLNPEDEVAWFNKGLSLYELDNYKESVLCFEHVIRLNPEEEDAWFFKGQILFEQGTFQVLTRQLE